MSADVSPWRVELPIPDDREGGHFVWTFHRRVERRSLTMRGQLRPHGSRHAAKLLVPRETEVPRTPSPPSPPAIEAPFDAWLASTALLVFGAVHAVWIVAWAFSGAPWNWRSACTLAATGAALFLSVALRRRPSRRLVLYGLGVALFSLARVVGVEWTWSAAVGLLLGTTLGFVLSVAAWAPRALGDGR